MTTNIPIQFLDIENEGYHLLIKVLLNNKTANLIIDTGASRSAFDINQIDKFINDKELKEIDKLSTGLGTNTMKSHSINIDKVQFGDYIIDNYNAIVIDMSHVNESYKSLDLEPIDGVLGGDILYDTKAIIDYDKKCLILKYN